MYYIWRMMPAALASVAVFLVLHPCRHRRLARLGQHTTTGHELSLLLLIMFVAGLFRLIVLPAGGAAAGEINLNLQVFRVISDTAAALRRGSTRPLLINFLGNILMFVPVGALPSLLWRRVTPARGILLGGLISLSFELCQLPLGRACDVDDLWLNTAGAALGVGFARLLDRLFPKLCAGLRVKEVCEAEELQYGHQNGN